MGTTKCDVCKKNCSCVGCSKNDTCKYAAEENCKVTSSCGMRRSWVDGFMKKFTERV